MFTHTLPKLSRSLAAAALATVAAAPGLAQTHTLGVQQVPGGGGNPGDAIYEVHLSGPAGGVAAVAVGSLGVQRTLRPLGNLYLNPLAWMGILGPVPLDANGQGRLRVVIPLTDNNWTPCFQAVFVDPRNNVRLSHNWTCAVNAAVPGTPFGYLLATDGLATRLDTFVRGRPGTHVRLRIRRGNQIIVDRVVPIGPGGTGTGAVGVDVQPGDRWSVVYTDTANNLGIGRSGTF